MEIPVEDDAMWWRLKAGRGGVLEDDWLERGIVSTGWGIDSGDFREMSPSEFREQDPDDQYQPSKFIGYHDEGMQPGDVVIAYAPSKGHVSGVGKVGEAKYDEARSWRYLSEEEAEEAQVVDHHYWRPVEWFDWGTPVAVSDLSQRYQVNGSDQIPTPGTLSRIGTLTEDADRIEQLIEEIYECETVDTSGGGFGPERESQIQDWVVSNIRRLDFFNPRKEVQTSVGRVDVLAESEDGEAVIEIKRGRAGDRALGQLLGYVGSREDESGSDVEGILIAEGFTSRVRMAASGIDNVSLFEFSVTTELREV